MDTKLSILIVEDEESIRSGLVDVFLYHGYTVDTAADGKTGLEKSLTDEYDLILLDVMLPEMDGFTVCNEIRKHSLLQPIIMLTAKTSEDDIITGLTHGADDYVGKPFSVRQLVLRVEAVLRRSQKIVERSRILNLGTTLRIDTATLEGKDPDSDEVVQTFTRKEVDILQYLTLHSDRPVSRDELLEEVWGYKKSSQIETRTVDIHIAKLRRKIEQDSKNPQLLTTIRGEGYRLQDLE
jgi:two-component system response regulator RegX3